MKPIYAFNICEWSRFVQLFNIRLTGLFEYLLLIGISCISSLYYLNKLNTDHEKFFA